MHFKGEVFTEKFNKNSIKFDLQPIQEVVKAEPMSNAMVPYEDNNNSTMASPLKSIMPNENNL